PSSTSDGLKLHDHYGSTVEGLILNSFNRGFEIRDGGYHSVFGNFIGTDATGSVAEGNEVGVHVENSSNNTIGNASIGNRNVISGNTEHGIRITGSNAVNNTVQGNYIGLDATGTTLLTNGSGAIQIIDASDNTIGGATIDRNVIAGTSGAGVQLIGTADGTLIGSNYIGTDSTGQNAVGQLATGIEIGRRTHTDNITNSVAANNVVSNNEYGIVITAGGGHTLRNNTVGLAADGITEIGNTRDGIVVQNSNNNSIGGFGPDLGNVISGNGQFNTGTNEWNGIGLVIFDSEDTTVYGNLIGTDVTGTIAAGNKAAGVLIEESDRTLLGGSGADKANVISGNRSGIILNKNANDNLIQGNTIGLDINGDALGNTTAAIYAVDVNGTGNVIGGSAAGDGNVISGNDQGLVVAMATTGTSENVQISRNAIYNNTSDAIVLDANTNHNIAAPVLVDAEYDAGTGVLTANGTFNGQANSTYEIEYFANTTNDEHGETFVASQSVTTDGSGFAAISLSQSLPDAAYLTATITSTSGSTDTSEFSNSMQINHRPTAADGAINVSSNVPRTLTVADFNFSDSDAGDQLESVRLQTIPAAAAGAVTKNGTAVAANATFTRAELNAGIIKYEYTGNANPPASFNFYVNDGTSDAQDFATMTVNLTGNVAPTITNPASIVNLAENSANNTTVHTFTMTDPDGPSQTFTITGGNTGNAFSIDNNGVVRVANSSLLDFDNGPTSYTLDIALSDGLYTTPGQVTINLTNVNEAPTINDATAPLLNEHSANGTAVFTVPVSDEDSGDSHTFSISGGNTGGAFAIDNSGNITVANSAALNFESITSFNLDVNVFDSGSLTDTAVIRVNLNDINEAPVINDAASSALNEHSANGTAVHTVPVTDPDAGASHTFAITAGNIGGAFAIDDSGNITVANATAVDFETTPDFSLTVEVDDGLLTDTATITVNLTNINEAPVINNAAASPLDENSAAGTAVYTVPVTDPDAGASHTFSITAGNTSGAFAIDNSGNITVANPAAIDFETNPTFALTVQVSDGLLTDTADITINLTDLNEAPVINDDTAPALDENSANGTAVFTVPVS
ncbi:cadherin domain-containing protein, partial [bacterium]|nr:cadherin domain-containing protein [bacterium]